ncbi:MAG: hypothetical protein KKC85_11005, partial [Gammaproteobacteria bacterium]|nr:hypothetical protein [Gammaproteobacteria bacterium]
WNANVESNMNKRWQIAALIFWLVSLVLPTVPTLSGASMRGYELLIRSAIGALLIPFSLFFPLHILSLCSNVLILREFIYVIDSDRHTGKPSHTTLGIAFLLNMYVGLYSLSPEAKLQGLLSLPGYYAWLAAFLALIVARALGQVGPATSAS